MKDAIVTGLSLTALVLCGIVIAVGLMISMYYMMLMSFVILSLMPKWYLQIVSFWFIFLVFIIVIRIVS